MLLVLKTGETRDQAIDRAFGSQLGHFLELAFQVKRIGDDIGGLTRSHERTGEESVEGYFHAA